MQVEQPAASSSLDGSPYQGGGHNHIEFSTRVPLLFDLGYSSLDYNLGECMLRHPGEFPFPLDLGGITLPTDPLLFEPPLGNAILISTRHIENATH